MKTNKNKKLLYGFGAVTTVVAPVLVTVACGSDTPTPPVEPTNQGLKNVTTESLVTAMFPNVSSYQGKLDPLKAKTTNLTVTDKSGAQITNVSSNIQSWNYTNEMVDLTAALTTKPGGETATIPATIINKTDQPTMTEMTDKDITELWKLFAGMESDRDGNIIQVGDQPVFVVATDNNGFYKVTNTADGNDVVPLFESPTGKWEKLFVGADNEISESAQMAIVDSGDTGTVEILITTEDKGFFLLSYVKESKTFSIEPIKPKTGSEADIAKLTLTLETINTENEIGDDASLIPLNTASKNSNEFLVFTPEAESAESAGFILSYDNDKTSGGFEVKQMEIEDTNLLATNLKNNKNDIAEEISYAKLPNADTADTNKLEFLISTSTEGFLQLSASRTSEIENWKFSAYYLNGGDDVLSKAFSNTEGMAEFEIGEDAMIIPYFPADSSTGPYDYFVKLDIEFDDNDDYIPPAIKEEGTDSFKMTYNKTNRDFTTIPLDEKGKEDAWAAIADNNNYVMNFGEDKFLIPNSRKLTEGFPTFYLHTFFSHHYSFDD